MSDTFTTIGEAASHAANDIFLSKTDSFINWLKGFITWENLFKGIGTMLILFVIWIIFRLIAKQSAASRKQNSRLSAQKS